MGWTAFEVPKGAKTSDVLIQELFSGDESRVLAHRVVNKVWYAACTSTDSDQVWGLAVIVDRRRMNGQNFCYKPVSEDLGPCDDLCPDAILDRLTDPENDYAAEWRARCRKNNRLARLVRNATSRHVFQTAPVNLSNGESVERFVVVGGQVWVSDTLGMQRYRVKLNLVRDCVIRHVWLNGRDVLASEV